MIFLHSSFRTSSTWLFAHFRSFESLRSYYEVFNEGLETISRRKAETHGPQDWHSKHPDCDPYFREFIPLINEAGGVKGFDRSMAFDSFIPADGFDGALSCSEKPYLESLIEHAHSFEKTPLLCCTRSLGRIAAVKNAFQGTHLLIYRSLLQQWCSYCEQAESGNTYFQMSVSRTIEANQHDPFFRYLHAHYPLGIPVAQAFDRFMLFHLYLYGQIKEASDLVLDVNKVADDRRYREKMQRDIAARCGMTLDLSDARNTMASEYADFGTPIEFSRRLMRLHTIVDREVPSIEGRDFIAQIVYGASEDYRKKHSRSLAARRMDFMTAADPLKLGFIRTARAASRARSA